MRVRILFLAAMVVFLVVGCSDHNQGTLTPENGGADAVAELNGETNVAPFPVWPELTNGDFESGDLNVGWQWGGTQNYLVSRQLVNGNYVARLETGEGPTGDADCENSLYSNFASLDQFFLLPKNNTIECDFLVPLPAEPDPSENATCAGFDRIELDFLVVDYEPGGAYQRLAFGVISISYVASVDRLTGHMQVNDFVLGTVISADFVPGEGTPVNLGPLAIRSSDTRPGWTHASMAVDRSFFPWLSDINTCRVVVRNEDNRRTGQEFDVFVDNYQATSPAVVRQLDIKPGACPNVFNPRSRGKLSVAILGSEYVDVHEIDVSSLILEGLVPERSSIEDVSAPVEVVGDCDCAESGPDGIDDLTLKFSALQFAEVIGHAAPGESVPVSITGNMLDGKRFEYSDCVVMAGGRRNIPIAGKD